MKTFLDNFAAVLGAVTITLLLMSVTHEYGYFWAIGRQFQTFVSTTDYFGNAVLWLPWMAIILYGWLDWGVLFGQKVFRPLTFKKKGDVIFIVSVFVMIIGSLFYFGQLLPYVWASPLLFLWLMYGANILPFANTDVEIFVFVRRALLIAPAVMITLLAWGYMDGDADLVKIRDPYRIEFKGGRATIRVILRSLDKGLLVRDVVTDRIEFLRWDEITNVSRLGLREKTPLSCRWFGVNCGDVQPAP